MSWDHVKVMWGSKVAADFSSRFQVDDVYRFSTVQGLENSHIEQMQ